MPRGTNSRPGHGLRRPDSARRRARASKCLQFPVLFGVSHASIVEAELRWGVDGAIRRRCVRPVRHVWLIAQRYAHFPWLSLLLLNERNKIGRATCRERGG